MKQEIEIAQDDDGIRLDRWFKRHVPHINHGFLQKALRKKQVLLGGKKCVGATRINTGQIIVFPSVWLEEGNTHYRPKKTQDVDPRHFKEIEAHILYEDDHLLVINKPSGLATQGGSGQSISVDGILRARAQACNEDAPKLVHRLDKDTSGVLLLAKTSRDAAELAKAFASKTAEKRYWALVISVPEIKNGTIDMPLAKREAGKDSGYEKVQTEEDGKRAITHYETLEVLAGKFAWLALTPVTGRTHQLRVHMAEIGHPIIGDGKYGGSEAFIEGDSIAKKLHLHARSLAVTFRGKEHVFEAPLSGHMKQSWKMLGLVATK